MASYEVKGGFDISSQDQIRTQDPKKPKPDTIIKTKETYLAGNPEVGKGRSRLGSSGLIFFHSRLLPCPNREHAPQTMSRFFRACLGGALTSPITLGLFR